MPREARGWSRERPSGTSGLPGPVLALATDPSGLFVFAATAQGIAVFSVDAVTGSLNPVAQTSAINFQTLEFLTGF